MLGLLSCLIFTCLFLILLISHASTFKEVLFEHVILASIWGAASIIIATIGVST